MEINHSKPLRPMQLAEDSILRAILSGSYPPGTVLPNERSLAQSIGVTRPTLREAMQRLAREGWLTIRHGKSTFVNDYLVIGGMGLLSTLAHFTEYLPEELVSNLLEVRTNLLPEIAQAASKKSPQVLCSYLELASDIDDSARSFVHYDWKLHLLMARESSNAIYTLMLNDFTTMYELLGLKYFEVKEARKHSLTFYRRLNKKIRNSQGNVKALVRQTLEQSEEIWRKIGYSNIGFGKSANQV